jgi:hypothetical protein
MKRVLDVDRSSHQVTYHDYDHETKVTTIQIVQDMEPYLRVTQAERNRDVGGAKGLSETSRKQIKENWWHVARIPVGVQHEWLKRYGVDIYNKEQEKEVRKLLNDPEWKYLRSNEGRV